MINVRLRHPLAKTVSMLPQTPQTDLTRLKNQHNKWTKTHASILENTWPLSRLNQYVYAKYTLTIYMFVSLSKQCSNCLCGFSIIFVLIIYIHHEHYTGSYNSPKAEVFPFSYNYAVNDDYSGSAFTASESDNKLGARSVTYSTDDVNGYVAKMSYEGAPTYPQTTAVVAQPAVSVARSPLGESTAQATSYLD